MPFIAVEEALAIPGDNDWVWCLRPRCRPPQKQLTLLLSSVFFDVIRFSYILKLNFIPSEKGERQHHAEEAEAKQHHHKEAEEGSTTQKEEEKAAPPKGGRGRQHHPKEPGETAPTTRRERKGNHHFTFTTSFNLTLCNVVSSFNVLPQVEKRRNGSTTHLWWWL